MPHAIVVPALPVLVPGVAVAIALLLRRLHRAGALTPARAVSAVLVSVYGAVVLGHVLLPFPIRAMGSRPGHHWWWQVNLVPLVDPDRIGLVLNAALFLPLGLLLPLVTEVTTLRRAVSIAFLTSLAIEVTQLVGDLTISGGRVFDVDDLIANTAGAVVGLLLLRLLLAIPPVARAARAASWPQSTSGRGDAPPVVAHRDPVVRFVR